MARIGTHAMLILIAMFGVQRVDAILTPPRPQAMLASSNERLKESFASTIDLNEYNYKQVLASKNEVAMEAFILRLMVKWNMAVKDKDRSKLEHFATAAAQSGQYKSLPDLKKALQLQEWIVKKLHAVAAKVSKSVHKVADILHYAMGKSKDAVSHHEAVHAVANKKRKRSISRSKTAHATKGTAKTESISTRVAGKLAKADTEKKMESESDTTANADVNVNVSTQKIEEHHDIGEAHNNQNVEHEVSPSKHVEEHVDAASVGKLDEMIKEMKDISRENQKAWKENTLGKAKKTPANAKKQTPDVKQEQSKAMPPQVAVKEIKNVIKNVEQMHKPQKAALNASAAISSNAPAAVSSKSTASTGEKKQLSGEAESQRSGAAQQMSCAKSIRSTIRIARHTTRKLRTRYRRASMRRNTMPQLPLENSRIPQQRLVSVCWRCSR
eukprot:TRINITY_DN212_c1_g2_i12.p1 TRINITY_DN212_c1_g2~~TRINITY_DN212_c1_g2_i12.p1  ORF type:complete len:441 (+),score=96.23 TRINITY_DN212_c1_g2_i12:46-1368(+)